MGAVALELAVVLRPENNGHVAAMAEIAVEVVVEIPQPFLSR
ncbi:hypothetical protein [Muricoccus nepalensis]|nr:hypothetical protein [Roseomonas nepalensis]